MCLEIVYGDCLNAVYNCDSNNEPCILFHGCNAQGVMGAGFAAFVKKLYPFAYKAYRSVDFYHLGQVIVVDDENSNVIVANAITQQYFGRNPNVLYVDYDAVACSAMAVAKYAGERGLSVHMPLIGSGLGGGDAKRLTAILQAAFIDSSATLWLQDK